MTDLAPLVLCFMCALVVTCQDATRSRRHQTRSRATPGLHATPTPTPAVIEYNGQVYKLK